MRNYKNYAVWRKSHELVLYIYNEILELLPPDEKYALSSQLKRAAYSIPMNIAEGCGRNSDRDFVHFLDMALGSVHEVEYCLLLMSDLKYLKQSHVNSLQNKTGEVKAMLIALIKSIRA